jgi:8-oxo-dGTP diphosphatase
LWSALDAIPYHRMWKDDQYWLPLLLNEQPFRGRFVFEGEDLCWSEVSTDVVW